jgi:hypothetical protein
LTAAKKIISIVSADAALVLAGVSAYECSVTRETPEAVDANMAALFSLLAVMIGIMREAYPECALVISAGSSANSDRMISALAPICDADGKAIRLSPAHIGVKQGEQNFLSWIDTFLFFHNINGDLAKLQMTFIKEAQPLPHM